MHADPAVRIAIEAASVQLRFLPYSPDFNPIGQAFAKLKAFLRAARPRSFDEVTANLSGSILTAATTANSSGRRGLSPGREMDQGRQRGRQETGSLSSLPPLPGEPGSLGSDSRVEPKGELTGRGPFGSPERSCHALRRLRTMRPPTPHYPFRSP